LDDF